MVSARNAAKAAPPERSTDAAPAGRRRALDAMRTAAEADVGGSRGSESRELDRGVQGIFARAQGINSRVQGIGKSNQEGSAPVHARNEGFTGQYRTCSHCLSP